MLHIWVPLEDNLNQYKYIYTNCDGNSVHLCVQMSYLLLVLDCSLITLYMCNTSAHLSILIQYITIFTCNC